MRLASPLLAICLLPSFAGAAFFQFAHEAFLQQESIWTETHNAIETIQLRRTGQKAAQVQRLTMEDLARTSPLSDSALKWLNNSQIVLVREAISAGTYPPRSLWPYESAFMVPLQPGTNAVPYSATIRTANGHECNLRFWTTPTAQGGIVYQSCQ